MTYTPDEQIERARDAARLLGDETLAEAFRDAEATFIQQWRESELGDTQIRESAYAKLQALAEVQRVLRSIIQDGDLQVGRLNKRGADIPAI